MKRGKQSSDRAAKSLRTFQNQSSAISQVAGCVPYLQSSGKPPSVSDSNENAHESSEKLVHVLHCYYCLWTVHRLTNNRTNQSLSLHQAAIRGLDSVLSSSIVNNPFLLKISLSPGILL